MNHFSKRHARVLLALFSLPFSPNFWKHVLIFIHQHFKVAFKNYVDHILVSWIIHLKTMCGFCQPCSLFLLAMISENTFLFSYTRILKGHSKTSWTIFYLLNHLSKSHGWMGSTSPCFFSFQPRFLKTRSYFHTPAF